MRKKTIVLACVTFGLAFATVLVVQNWLDSERAQLTAKKPKPASKPAANYVLVASRPLPAGTFVRRGDLTWQSWPNKQVNTRYIMGSQTTSQKPYVGSVVRRGIVAGQPITDDMVVKPGDRGFLAAVLQPGMRAIAVPVNATTGIAGLVFPGDRIDLILTFTAVNRGSTANATITRRVSETVLSRVRVIAIDQRTDDIKGKPKIAKTVTLEVTPKQAEVVTLASRMGRLSLSLHSLAKAKTPRQSASTSTLLASGDTSTVPYDTRRPRRGITYTIDSHVSRVLRSRVQRPEVFVMRGGKMSVVTVDKKVIK